MSKDNVLEAVLDDEMLQLEAQIRALQERRDWLRGLKRRATAPSNGTHPLPTVTAAVKKVAHKRAGPHAAVKKPTASSGPSVNDLIIQFVKERKPAAVPRSEIVDFVMERKTSTSGNKRAMMFGYVSGLVSRGFLTNSGPGEVVLGSKVWNPKRREG